MDGDNTRIIGILCSFVFLIGAIIGMLSISSKYKADTYDCTVKCPNNSHSIYVDEKCFCEVK